MDDNFRVKRIISFLISDALGLLHADWLTREDFDQSLRASDMTVIGLAPHSRPGDNTSPTLNQ